MTDIKHCVIGEIYGEETMLVFRSDEAAANWALHPGPQQRRLWDASVRLGQELFPVPPGPASLRVASRKDAPAKSVDTPEGPA